MVMTQYLCFFARIAVENPEYLSNAVNNAGQQFHQPGLLGALVDFWMDKVTTT